MQKTLYNSSKICLMTHRLTQCNLSDRCFNKPIIAYTKITEERIFEQFSQGENY